MSYTDKFEAFSLIKNGSTYKLLPFSEQQNDKIKTTQDKTSTDKKTKNKNKKIQSEKQEYDNNLNTKHKKQ